MPYMKNGKRDYEREKQWDKENGRYPERAARLRARRRMIKEGEAERFDGKDVGHKTAISKGGSNSKSNLEMQSRSENRSFARNKDGSMKSEKSKREARRRKS